MPQSVSESSLVSNVSPIHLECSEIVLRDEEDDTVLDLGEYTCTNRELVNLENAAINIDNSSDVIIGPYTQLNVNGNVTIYQNGNRDGAEAINGAISNKEDESNNTTDGAKLAKVEKTESEEKDSRKFSKRTKYVKIFLSISFSTTVLVALIFTIIFFTQKTEESDYIPDVPGDDNQTIGDRQILDRTKWHGRPPKKTIEMKSPVSMVIIKHTGGGFCSEYQECAGKLQTIQSNAVSKGADDIYYSFLLGGDGIIYVGRGWNVQPYQRNNMIDIAFMGSYAFDEPTPTMIDAAQFLLRLGVEKSKLTKDYKLVCHNQTMATESPGPNLFEEVKKWPHYDAGLYFADDSEKTMADKT